MPTATIVPAVAAKGAQRAGEAVVDALKTPILRRKVIERWDEDRQEWVPETREREHNVTAVGVAVLGLLGLGAASVAQRAARTGTMGMQVQYEFIVTAPKPGDTLGAPTGKKRTVWSDTPVFLSPVVGESTQSTGRTRRRPKIRTADSTQGYNPVVGRLL